MRLNWNDNAEAETSYRIDRWTKTGWRKSQIVPAGSTAAVIDNLSPGSATTYRVSARSMEGGSAQSLNVVSVQTAPEDTSGWYKVKLTSGMTAKFTTWRPENRSDRGIADTLKVLPQHIDGSDTARSKWVYAGSWQAAVWTVLGTYSKNADGSISSDPTKVRATGTGNATNGGDLTYYNGFPAGGFRVGTGKEIKAQELVEASSANPSIVDFKLPANDTKLVVLEDSYNTVDRDYDDWVWGVETQFVPAVSITPQGTALEGQSKAKGDPQKLGFYLRRTGSTASSLSVSLQNGGDAEVGKDVWGIPSAVTFPVGQNEVFVPIGMTEDVVPEWTELYQVRIKASETYKAQTPGQDYVSFKITDDDYFYVGSYEAPDADASVTVSELSGGSVVSSHDEPVSLEVVGTEFNAVFGMTDADWLPWTSGVTTSSGDTVNDYFDNAVDMLPLSNPVTGGLRASAVVPGDPMVHARNLLILEEIKPGFSFEASPDGTHYFGTDAAGRVTQFDLNLTEVYYKGTHHGFFLRNNDDGSIDKWGGEFVEDPKLIERVRPSHKELKQQINLLKDKYFTAYVEATEEHRIMREQFGAFVDTLTALLEAGVSVAPGAAVIDIEQAVTGHDPFNPNVQVSGGDRAMSVAGVLPIVGAVTHAKKLLNASEQLRENWRSGRAFQESVTAMLGELENKKRLEKFRMTLASGRKYLTVPDIVSVAKNSIIEIKRVSRLDSLTGQLEAQILAAKKEGMKYCLILGPDATAAGIAGSITDMMERILGMDGRASIVKFNPDTRKLEHLWP